MPIRCEPTLAAERFWKVAVAIEGANARRLVAGSEEKGRGRVERRRAASART
jgi:hypothetical protein